MDHEQLEDLIKRETKDAIVRHINPPKDPELNESRSMVRRAVDMEDNTFIPFIREGEVVVVRNDGGRYSIESSIGGKVTTRQVSKNAAIDAMADMVEAGYRVPRNQRDIKGIATKAFDAGLMLAAGWAVIGLIAKNSERLLPWEKNPIHNVAQSVWDVIGFGI